MRTRFLALSCGFLLLVLGALMVTNVLASAVHLPLRLLQTLTQTPALLMIFVGLMLIAIVLVLEWRAIIRYLRVGSMSIAFVERTQPRLPGRFEIVATNLLTLLLVILGAQCIQAASANTAPPPGPGTVFENNCSFRELSLSPDTPEVGHVHCDATGHISWDGGLGHYWFAYRTDGTVPAPGGLDGCLDGNSIGGPQGDQNWFDVPGDGTYTARICTNVPNVLATNHGRAFTLCIGASCLSVNAAAQTQSGPSVNAAAPTQSGPSVNAAAQTQSGPSVNAAAQTQSGLSVNQLGQSGPLKTETSALIVKDKQEQISVVKPCLTVGPARSEEQGLSDTEILLGRLLDPYGLPLIHGLKLPGSALLSRSQFLMLLQRTQCIPLLDPGELTAGVRQQVKLGRPDIGGLEDIPPGSPDRQVAFSLMAKGVPVGKHSQGKLYGDLKTPILRSDAARMMASLIEGAHEVGPLPVDIIAIGPLAQSIGKLSAIGVLPSWFRQSFASNQGLVTREAVLMLLRLSFSRGLIGVGSTMPPDATLPPSGIPWIGGRSCLVRDPIRAGAVRYTDVLPGDPLFPLVYDLGAIGTRGENDRTLWLLPGGLVKEYGILLGETTLHPREPVTMIEFLRALSILTCKSIESTALMPDWIGGAADQPVVRDGIANLPRDTTFASRVFYAVQDHERASDLSLLRFAPVASGGSYSAPADNVDPGNAASMFASVILFTKVKAGELTSIEAENQAGDLTQAILSFLHLRSWDAASQLRRGGSVDRRAQDTGSTRTLSRADFLRILGAIVGGRGEQRVHGRDEDVWWARLKL